MYANGNGNICGKATVNMYKVRKGAVVIVAGSLLSPGKKREKKGEKKGEKKKEFLRDFMPTRAQTSYISAVSEICESPSAENNELSEFSMPSAAASATSFVSKRMKLQEPFVACVLEKFLDTKNRNIHWINSS
jgi:hypothetical protein